MALILSSKKKKCMLGSFVHNQTELLKTFMMFQYKYLLPIRLMSLLLIPEYTLVHVFRVHNFSSKVDFPDKLVKSFWGDRHREKEWKELRSGEVTPKEQNFSIITTWLWVSLALDLSSFFMPAFSCSLLCPTPFLPPEHHSALRPSWGLSLSVVFLIT